MVATTVLLPVIDINEYIQNPLSENAQMECKKLSEAVKTFGAFAIRDSRVTEEQNAEFLNLMEDYFNQSLDAKLKDQR
jgi:isopenicillin N synthase-like dioxygenase